MFQKVLLGNRLLNAVLAGMPHTLYVDGPLLVRRKRGALEVNGSFME